MKIVLVIVGVLLVVAGLVAIFLPQLLSTSAGTRVVQNVVNGEIRGVVKIEGLSMSWGGPTHIQGLEVLDPDGRVVLQAHDVRWSAGLWGAINNPQQFKELLTDSPDVKLYVDADGGVSLAKAFELRTPKTPSVKPQPVRIDHLGVTNATVTIVPHDSPPYEVRQLSADLAIQTLADLTAKLKFATPDGATLSGDLAAKDLWDDAGNVQPDKATIQGRLVSDRPTDVSALAAALAPDSGVEGKAGLNFTADVKSGQGRISFETQGRGLATPQGLKAGAGAVSLDLNGHVDFTPTEIGGPVQLTLADKGGQLDLTFHYPLDQKAGVPADYVQSAIVEGRNVALPAFTVSGKGQLDIARLARAMPGLFKIRKDVVLQRGDIIIKSISVSGGAKPSVVADLQATGFGGTRQGQAITLPDTTLALDATIQEGKGLLVSKGDVVSGRLFEAHGKGGMDSFDGTVKADLAAVVEQARQVFELPSFELRGTIDGQLPIHREGSVVRFSPNLAVTGFRYISGDRLASAKAAGKPADMHVSGDATLDKGVLNGKGKLTIGEEVLASADGRYDFGSGAFDATWDLQKAQLTTVGPMAASMGVTALADWAGMATGKGHASRASADKPIVVGGAAALDGVTIAGKPVGSGSNRTIRIEYDDVRIQPDTGSLQVAAVRLRSAFANADGGDWRYDNGTLTGTFTLRADVATSMTVVASLTQANDLPASAGSLDAKGSFQAKGGRVQAVLEGGIDNFVMGQGADAFREKRVNFGYDLTLEQARELMTVNKAGVEFPGLIQLSATGQVQEYTSRQVLDLQVKYNGNWPRAVQLLHQYAPSTKDMVSIIGPSGDTFPVKGSVRDRQVKVAFGSVRATPGVQWQSANICGLDLSSVNLRPQLANGRLTLAMTRIPGSSGGAVNVGGELDMNTTPYTLRIPGRVKVLDKFRINQKVGEQLLSHINPVLGATNKLEGTVSLETTDLVLPMGKELLKGGSGRGHMDLSQVEITPKGILGQLAQLGGLNISRSSLIMRPQGVDFVIEKGRIRYDNFRIAMGAVDLTFRGSVGFDDSVEMWVSMPLSSQLIGALKTGLPTDYLLNFVGSVRVEIPIRGTRLAPMLDLNAVDLGKILPKPPNIPNPLKLLPNPMQKK